MTPSPPPPSRDDSGTTPTTPAAISQQSHCPVCWTAFTRIGRQQYCSDICRKTAWRRRHTPPPAPPAVPPRTPRRDITVYACPDCGTRYLADQRCPDCGVFCHRVGLGGRCPSCDEPVTLTDLIPEVTPPPL